MALITLIAIKNTIFFVFIFFRNDILNKPPVNGTQIGWDVFMDLATDNGTIHFDDLDLQTITADFSNFNFAFSKAAMTVTGIELQGIFVIFGFAFFHVKTQRKVMSLFRDFLQGFSPLYLPDCLQNAITFFLFGLC